MKVCMMFCMKNSHASQLYLIVLLTVATACLSSCDEKKHVSDNDSPSDNLNIAIIRHAEKPIKGDNLSCQGQNRALQLAAVLHQKFNIPAAIYVPSLKSDDETKHSRMFQTITPFAIKYNVAINSKYSADENEKIIKSVLKKHGTILMVWEHSAIQSLASSLGVKSPPEWTDTDFDSIWLVNYSHGKAQLTMDKEGLNPSAECNY
jgi:hypothetical protein